MELSRKMAELCKHMCMRVGVCIHVHMVCENPSIIHVLCMHVYIHVCTYMCEDVCMVLCMHVYIQNYMEILWIVYGKSMEILLEILEVSMDCYGIVLGYFLEFP